MAKNNNRKFHHSGVRVFGILFCLALVAGTSIIGVLRQQTSLAEAISVTNISPNLGPTTGGTEVTIDGAFFTEATKIIDIKTATYLGGPGAIALDSQGQVWSWGGYAYSPTGKSTTTPINLNKSGFGDITSNTFITKIFAFSQDSYGGSFYAIDRDGKVYVWGTWIGFLLPLLEPDYDKTSQPHLVNGAQVTTSSGVTAEVLADNIIVKDIVAGAASDSTFLLDDAGNIWGMGYYDDSTGEQVETFVNLNVQAAGSVVSSTHITKILTSDGSQSLYALDDTGQLHYWENVGCDPQFINLNQTLGGALSPTTVIKDFTTDDYGSQTFAVDDSGQVYAWGWGNLGDGINSNSQNQPINVNQAAAGDIGPSTVIKKVTARSSGTAFIDDNGQLYYAGDGYPGTGSTTEFCSNPAYTDYTTCSNNGYIFSAAPVPVNVSAAAAGDLVATAKIIDANISYDASWAIDDNGHIYMWGEVDILGDANTSTVVLGDSIVPRDISGFGLGDVTSTNILTKIVQYGQNSSYFNNVYVIDDLGRVYGWTAPNTWPEILGNGTPNCSVDVPYLDETECLSNGGVWTPTKEEWAPVAIKFGSATPPPDSVTIGGVPCTNLRVVSATRLICTTSAHIAGKVDVVITRGAESLTLANAYEYSDSQPTLPVVPGVPNTGRR